MSTKPINLEIVKAPSVKIGNDAELGKHLMKLFTDAQNGMRRVVAFGLFAWEIKETKLKHGQWGPWLAENAPKLSRLDSVTGKPKSTHACDSYLATTKGVLESVGFKTVGKYLETISNSPSGGICHHGKFLLVADKKVPVEMKPLREKIFALIDGKTQKQLLLEFKQVEEDEAGNLRTKRGQLKGSKGLTKERREAAKLREEQERIEDLELACDDTVKWLEANCDDKHVGAVSPRKAERLLEAVQYAHDYLTNLNQLRKGK